MSANGGDNYWDTFIYIVAGAFFGIPLLTKLSSTVTAVLVDAHILTTTDVLVPIVDDVGLDLGRCLVVGALAALTVIGLVWSVRRRINTKDGMKK